MLQTLEENKQQYLCEYYVGKGQFFPGIEKHEDRCGWADYYLLPNALFSRRRVFYDVASFPDKLHSHGFYEIVVFLGGTVSYVSGNQIFTPQHGDIIIFPPGCEHTVRTSRDGIYDRAVLYVEPAWFQTGAGGHVPELYREKGARCYMIRPEFAGKFLDHLANLEECLTGETEDSAMAAQGYLSLLLTNLARHSIANTESSFEIPHRLVQIREYIDGNFQLIESVDELSSKFYYSREHICRLFKDYYKITPSEYIHRKKVEYARQSLYMGNSVRYAFDVSGFRSYSAFVKAFRDIVGTPPGKYRKMLK